MVHDSRGKVRGRGAALRLRTLSVTGSESVWPMVSGSYEDSWEKRRAKWWLRLSVVLAGMDL